MVMVMIERVITLVTLLVHNNDSVNDDDSSDDVDGTGDYSIMIVTMVLVMIALITNLTYCN